MFGMHRGEEVKWDAKPLLHGGQDDVGGPALPVVIEGAVDSGPP